ncbi:SsrA-binding protein SmpB [Haloplasma contractile]|uniref:SsrA-binding protein n=1 Tax=Haloplasma contractile SSD-17B TaxID=1033810 RepID=U2EF60_9MOLU|nr:SsrA-binding protein SmpB [Haloplasma contractile]ERJ13321.1 SsrA-binding protein [Haloplasma contractile SSD-17B]
MPKGLGKIVAQNKKAYHNYFIEEKYEAGLVLQGTEIKSIRSGKVSMNDAYAGIHQGEAYLSNLHISQYEFGTKSNHDPTRRRKLLLHNYEIKKLIGKIQQGGYTLVPTKVYLKNGYAKVQIALAKGKKLHDKRQTLKRKDANRQIERAMKDRYK